jgi:uncharacterized membrane protein
MKGPLTEESLEHTIGDILMLGVATSVVVESLGIVDYYLTNGNLDITFQPDLALKGTNIFGYAETAILRIFTGDLTPYSFLGLGVVLLLMTPYLRVWASVIYFTLVKNMKYVFITGIVLIILTASMLAH